MITLDEIELPGESVWLDEFDWTPKETSESRGQSGRLTIQSGTKIGGRPITLSGPDCITKRPTALALQALLTRASMTLTLHDGREFTVAWRHKDKPIEAPNFMDLAYPNDTTHYRLTLRLQIL